MDINIDNTLQSYVSTQSVSSTPVVELNINSINNLVREVCADNGVLQPVRIYGLENGCPICYNDYSNDNWIVLHPCGHLICSDCLSGIHQQIRLVGGYRRCPMCQGNARWIGRDDNNLNRTSTPFTPQTFPIGNPFNYNPPNINLPHIPVQPNPFRVGTPTPQRVRNMGRLRQRDNRQENFTRSRPPLAPIIEDNEEKEVVDVKGEISFRNISLDGDEKKIGNLSIVAKDLVQVQNGIDLVVVMDVSGSMSSVARDCIQIMKHTVDSLSNMDRLSIITFDSDAKQLFPLQPMTSLEKSTCKELIETCFTGGSTNLESALDLLIKVKEDGMIGNRPFKVILLSDGQPDSGREGFGLVQNIYRGDIKPEVFSCTFGGSVKADTLKRLLLPENAHYYKHISNMEEFKILVSEIGLDKNVVIGTGLHIQFKGVKGLSNLVHPINNEWNDIHIPQIKTGDIFTLPLEFDNENYEFKVFYQNMEGNTTDININEIEGIGDFVLHHYWYKKISEMIKGLDRLSTRPEKIERLNYINTLVTVENLGDFLGEINSLMHQTRMMINNSDNSYQHYNTYTSSVERVSSHSTPTVSSAYRSYSQQN